jgi:hypothetical protein
MNSQNVVYICNEYYSAIKNEIKFFEGKWMQLDMVILSETNQDQKDKGHMFSLMCKLGL